MVGSASGGRYVSLEIILEALSIPEDAKVEQRIPKKLLVEQGAPTTADKQQILDGIDELKWVAALKPTNIGVPVFRDAEREYMEISILSVIYRQGAKVPRLTELIHRAVPYPVLLVASNHHAEASSVSVSAAHKRFSQNEAGKLVVDEIITTHPITDEALQSRATQDFLRSLAMSRLSERDMFTFYRGWLNCIVGYISSRFTGTFALPQTDEQTELLRKNIAHHSQVLDELSALRAQALKEKQINRLVTINLKIRRLESQLVANHSALSGN